MCTIRCFEESVKRDILNGEIPGFVHLYIGEEAIGTGICAALRDTDLIESTHRGHGHCVAKGADVNKMMAEIFGKKDGLCHGKGGSMHIADFSVGMLGANGVVGGGYNLATGAALANKMVLKNDTVSVVFFGDGASNRGTFHEAANVAAAWKLPVIFVNEMNCWASTTPYRTTTAVEDISDRAKGYNMPGVIVDGQNVFEVYQAAVEAVARARRGEGPTFIEAKTYRIEGHFVGDPEAQDSVFNTAFTGIEYKVGKGTDPSNMASVNVAVSSNTILFPTQNAIDLNSMNSAYVSVNLLDQGFTECGTFSLVVTVTANDGVKDYQRTEVIPFERDAAEYCRTEDTTSQQPVKAEIPMTSCQVELSTNMNPGLSLSTCTAVPAGSPADITFVKAGTRNEPELSATAGAGVFVTPITNGDLPPATDDYEVDIWPEDMNPDRSPATAYVSDFKFKTIEGTQLNEMILNSNQIYVAKTAAYNAETGAGFYAFALTETTEGNNGDYTFKVKLYKVQ